MELFFVLFFLVLTAVLIVGGKFLQSNPQIVQRTKKILHANRQPPSDPVADQRALETAFKNLRKAKQEEHYLHLNQWQQVYLQNLKPTDPERVALEVKRNGINVEEAKFVVSAPADTEEISYSHRVVKGLSVLRGEPNKQSQTLATLKNGTKIQIDGYTYGEKIGYTDIWYRIDDKNGIYATAYIWAGSTTQPEPKGLPRVFPENTPKSPAAVRDLERKIDLLNAEVENSLRRTAGKTSREVRAEVMFVPLKSPKSTRWDATPKEYIPSTIQKVIK